MEDRLFLNHEVARITGINGRTIISWSEKRLVVPFEESPGVGKKRLYSYTNLLEFALFDALLNSVGMGFRIVSRISRHLKTVGLLEQWATNFEDYYEERFKDMKVTLEKSLLLLKPGTEEHRGQEKYYRAFLKAPFKPTEPVGVLVYFRGQIYEDVHIIPWKVEEAVNLDFLKKGLAQSRFAFLFDLGALKKSVDARI